MYNVTFPYHDVYNSLEKKLKDTALESEMTLVTKTNYINKVLEHTLSTAFHLNDAGRWF